jgi:hypothetical protein
LAAAIASFALIRERDFITTEEVVVEEEVSLATAA